MYTTDSAFRSRARVSLARLEAEMRRVGSPWAERAGGLYELIEQGGHDPAVWLAIGLREHRLLTDSRAVALRLETNSWTNARSVRLPGLSHDLVTTEDLRRAGITDREGPYVRYRSVEDSLRDGMARVDDVGYVYRQRFAVTLRQVLSIWTGPEGAPDAEGYIRFVVDRLNEWRAQGAPTGFERSWWDDPEIEFVPDRSGEYGYGKGSWGRNGHEIDLLIIHITAGVDSLGWLNGPNGNSAHYLTWPDGSPRAQLLPERDAAWTAGNREYNLRSINVEHEKLRLTDVWSDEEYRRLAWLAARIIRRNPGITPDRAHVIGHNEVPDPVHPGRYGGVGNHADPGPMFAWPRFMALLDEELRAGPGEIAGDPNAVHFPETGHWIVNDGEVRMLDFWRSRGGVEVCGFPLEGMTRDPDGVYRQLCENVLLECWLDGFGHHSGPHYRYGGLGQRCLAAITSRGDA
ncbi:hypothetical protein BH23CHL2_BH23CHL2_25190 [soil metagenome]